MIFTVILLLSCVHLGFLADDYVIPDNINIDDILKNKRLTTSYINCILDKGKCTPDGDKLRRTIPEALQNDCAKCNDKVKDNIKKVIKHVSETSPEQWKEIEAKYDPNGEYKKRNKEIIDDAGLKI